MTLHKLSAGSGYDYLTRQVAALDATDKGHTGLSTYYSERGEAPGSWMGSGLSGLDGVNPGDAVTGEQMSNLFAYGMHPLYDPNWKPTTPEDFRRDAATDWFLGRPNPVHSGDATPFQIEVARRVTALAKNHPDGVPDAVRAQVRTATAIEYFTQEHDRHPANEPELHGFIARNTRPATSAVAGYDLTFSPVKSVSTLWALADPATAAAVERAHNAAVSDALAFIEEHALFTRTGAAGVRQVEVTGLVATGFTHRDSRAGDPDLHTHVAVANKVQTRTSDGTPGKWLAVDGRVLFKAKVAASETYNTRLEHHLTEALGVRFAERDNAPGQARSGKRAVREIVGIDPDINARWSQRRHQITARQSDLAAEFRRDHGRPPTPVEALHLTQQANLETRDKKHTARLLTEQRTTWHDQAVEVLGSTEDVRRMLDQTLHPAASPQRAVVIDEAWIDTVAHRVIDQVEQHRATWQTWHVRAEAQRQIRAADLPTGAYATGLFATPDDLVDRVTTTAIGRHSISLAGPRDADHGIVEPAQLRRSDGTSVYAVAGAERFSSATIMAAEHRLLAYARTPAADGSVVVADAVVDMTLFEAEVMGTPLNTAQCALVNDMATSGRPLQLAIAPAGSGKTTALRALASAWSESGGNVVALAPSAAAVTAMTDVLDGIDNVHGDTLAKLTHTLNTHLPGNPNRGPDGWVDRIGPGTLVLIDEAGMADTRTLDQVAHHVIGCGGQVRLIGDDQQLAAIGAGGILRDIKTHAGAIHLDELMRFTDPVEANATLALREGDPDVLDFYEDRNRIHIGDVHSINDTLHAAWARDRAAGLDSLMVAPTSDQVADLNRRAQRTLFPPANEAGGDGADRRTTVLSDGNRAGVGDLIITRTNDRRLRLGANDWVKNGDRWHVTGLGDDGAIHARSARSGLTTRLPGGYVRDAVELGYATTIHTAQGTTVDTLHGLVTGNETRQDLYTMLTRGRHRNDVYITAGATGGDSHELITPDAIHPREAREILETILERDGAATSATTELHDAYDPALLWQQANERYADAFNAAAEDVVGTDRIAAITRYADRIAPGITDAPAWPTLRSRLIHLDVLGEDVGQLLSDAGHGGLDDAIDPAAVIEWRIQAIANAGDPANIDDGTYRVRLFIPIPPRLSNDPTWGTYLQARQVHATHLFNKHFDAQPRQQRETSPLSPPRRRETTEMTPSYGHDRATGPAR